MTHVNFPEPLDACPKALRIVLNKWKRGEASSADLIEMSYYTSLDFLRDFEFKPLPTAPDSVLTYRDMEAASKARMDIKDRSEFYKKNQDFYEKEYNAKARNRANKHHLKELLGWAKAKNLPQAKNIEMSLDTYSWDPNNGKSGY